MKIEECGKNLKTDFYIDSEKYEEDFKKFLEYSDVNFGKWNVIYLLLHCKIPRKMKFGKDIQIIPFGEWSCDDYNYAFERLISSRTANADFDEIFDKQKIKEAFGRDNPLGLLIFNNISAKSQKDALNKTKEKASSIITTISVLTNSSIEIKGYLYEELFGRGLKTINPEIFFFGYHNVFIDPDDFEISTIRLLKGSKDKYLVQLALKYLNDAQMETEEKYRMLKLWSALEYIAEDYVERTSKKLLSNESKSEIIEYILENHVARDSPEIIQKVQNAVGDLNRRNAKDKVRDLLDYCNYSIRDSVMGLKNIKNILNIIYQNRNCITHSGGCYKYDDTKKECKNQAYCKNSDLTLFDLNRELTRMLKSFIGKETNMKFKYQEEVPESIKKEY